MRVMLEPLRSDPNMRVRKTVLFAMRRLLNRPNLQGGGHGAER